MVDTLKCNEWFIMGDKDLKGAKILYEHGGDLGLVCFHLQQAVKLIGYYIKNDISFNQETTLSGKRRC